MDKYERIRKTEERPKCPDNEVRVTANTFLRYSLTYIASLFEKKKEEIVIKGTGFAIPKAISLATLVRHKFKGLHQIIEIGTMEIVDEFMPIEEGLDKVTMKRKIPLLSIILSLKELDKNNPGYSAPLPDSEIQPYQAAGFAPRGGYGRGRGYGRRGGFRRRGGYRRGGYRGREGYNVPEEQEEAAGYREEPRRFRGGFRSRRRGGYNVPEEQEEATGYRGERRRFRGGFRGRRRGGYYPKEEQGEYERAPYRRRGFGRFRSEGSRGRGFRGGYRRPRDEY